MIDTTYNGWTNYETWLTNLHFENFEFSDYKEDGTFEGMTKEQITDWIADYIETAVEEITYSRFEVGQSENLFLTDVVNCFLREVDWHDIAEQYIDDLYDA